MKKIYLLFICISLICFSFSSGIQAQSSTPEQEPSSIKIEGISIYPNPAPAGSKIYITSDLELTKTVKIYTVLGKQVFFKVLIGKELDISHLNRGVYIIKIMEANRQATKKLIIE